MILTVAIFVLITLGVTSGIFGIVGVFEGRRYAARGRMRRALEKPSGIGSASQLDLSALGSTVPQPAGQVVARSWLGMLLAQSGISLSFADLLSLLLGSALLGGLSAMVFGLSIVNATGIACSAPMCILLFLLYHRSQRRVALVRQLPDAFEVLGRALRAAQSVPSALQIVAHEFPGPVGEEFAICSEKQHLGVTFETALRELAERTGLAEMRIFSTALILNQRLGGNLAEVNVSLASAMRKRAQFQARVKAITGEGRMQATVLTTLPVLAFAGIYFIERDYVQVLLERPQLIFAALLSQLIGSLLIRRIVHFNY